MNVDIITTIFTHSVVFILGILFDRFLLRKVIRGEAKVEVRWAEIVRVLTLLVVFVTFMSAIISSQFFGGEQPNIWLSLGGVFSFGSLIGERDFFARLISGYVNKGGNQKNHENNN